MTLLNKQITFIQTFIYKIFLYRKIFISLQNCIIKIWETERGDNLKNCEQVTVDKLNQEDHNGKLM